MVDHTADIAVDLETPHPHDAAFALAVAALPEAGPARRLALHGAGELEWVWDEIRAGRAHRLAGVTDTLGGRGLDLARRWAIAAASIDPIALAASHEDAGVGVAMLGSPAYPECLKDDIEPPSLLCWLGDPDALVGARVAIVGTRRCTRYGRDVAFDLGRSLALAGVSVVSGLALGIDGAAHRGALSVDGAPPVGVVGSGLDNAYPRQHRDLWVAVAQAGVLLSEHVLGTEPRAWHFPSRNRILAGLADLVLVVESAERGGSLHTVDEAIARGVRVMAVPGPITSRASQGTNQLLRQGAHVITGVDDIFILLGLSGAVDRSADEPRAQPGPAAAAVLDAIGWQPVLLDQILMRTGQPVGEATSALDELERQGWIGRDGAWFERRAKSE